MSHIKPTHIPQRPSGIPQQDRCLEAIDNYVETGVKGIMIVLGLPIVIALSIMLFPFYLIGKLPIRI